MDITPTSTGRPLATVTGDSTMGSLIGMSASSIYPGTKHGVIR